MEYIYKHKASVRKIIDFILRSGNLESINLSDKKMLDGTKAHQKFQDKQSTNYEKEVTIKHEVCYENIEYCISGRIDGVIKKYKENIPLFDEIKATTNFSKMDGKHEAHLAQVKFYAYMYMCKYGLNKCFYRLTYIDLNLKNPYQKSVLEDYKGIKQFVFEADIEELKIYFFEVLYKYSEFVILISSFEQRQKESIRSLKFPYEIRKGQDKLMKGVYKSIVQKSTMFSLAPTGIGKTLATIFPSLKAIGESKTDKVFFLTAKTIGKEVAIRTVDILRKNGLSIKSTVITAKDKICLKEIRNCDPKECKFANGFFDRINEAIKDIYKNENSFDREIMTNYAKKYSVCPYEFSLQLAFFSALIICDYNYAFDPSAKIKTFFENGMDRYTLLIDEAHNMVDRSRKMFSAKLIKTDVLQMKRITKDFDRKLYGYCNKLNQIFIKYKNRLKSEDIYEKVELESPDEIYAELRGIIHRTEKIFQDNKKWQYMDILLEFYFEAYDFSKKLDMYGDNYVSTYQIKKGELEIRLYCVDPRPNIIEAIEGMQGVIYFSATLTPMNYYKYLLGGTDKSIGLCLESPFSTSKFELLIDRVISTKYIDRAKSMKDLIERIVKFVSMKKGNYLVYFPSYEYMYMVIEEIEELIQKQKLLNIDIFYQEKNLSEEQKEEFLNRFENINKKKTLLAFAVLGGMFGEGIDLVGEKLSGAIIVGVGLPKVGFNQNIIKNYFQEKMGNGFDYAYTYPGMNKVLQAAGRVIRTTEDIGTVLLIDRRFSTLKYEKLFPYEWRKKKFVRNSYELEKNLEIFWKK